MKFVAILISLLILTLSGAAEDASTLTVIGEGKVAVPADTVFVTISVTTEDENATQASLKNADALNRTIEALIDAGVKRDEVQSGRGRSVQRIQSVSRIYNNSTCMIVADMAVSRITDHVSIRFDAKDENLINRSIEAAKAEGAEADITGYALEDASEALAEARRRAIEDAEADAEDLASAAGLVLGKRLEIFEPSYPRVYQPSSEIDPLDISMTDIFDFSWLGMLDQHPTDNSAEPGMLEARSEVIVTYEVS
ncbi:MAG TPA: SIMPL domain-containing protein [Methanothrix sp.]|nr:SIMPL domain-containing protein [Methanothrix sp.]HPJ84314.1 SIMPL domain-containing protein [Methanothrix sp.]HPR65839.1 SIMPL domain-containing protein [Methanothrix sp.]